jgi:protein-disulfide isomerase
VAAAAIYWFVGRPDALLPSVADGEAQPAAAALQGSELMVPGPLGEMALGDPNAPNVIIEYASMTCPHCAAFHGTTFKKLKEKYIDTGKMRLVFREFPFDGLALRASVLARCSGAQGYFPMVDVLFSQQSAWSQAKDPMAALATIGRLGGIGQDRFAACMADQTLFDAVVKNRMTGANEHKVDSTPSFIINGDRLSGNLGLAEFEAAIDRHLR